MMIKYLGPLLAALGFLALVLPAQAQGVQLLLEDDQLLKNGRSAVHSGNLEKAKFYYEEALKRNSLSEIELITVHSDLCVTYMYLEQFEDAIVQCQASLELQSNRWETLNNLGTVYLVMGNYLEAIQVYEKGLKMKPKSRILLFNMDIAQRRLQEARIRQDFEMEKTDLDEGDEFQSQSLINSGYK